MKNEHDTVSNPATEKNAPARKRGHRDLLAALASGFVGALALATSTYNVYLQRQQVRAQVWPRLEVVSDYMSTVFSITVINRGAGPAEVKRIRVTVDGKPAADWLDVERKLLRRTNFDVLSQSIEPIEGKVLNPGLEALTFKVPERDDALGMFWEANRLATEICYCSSLGDCWLYKEHSALEPGETVSVNECTPDATPFRAATPQTMAELRAKFAEAMRAKADAGAPAGR